MKGGGAIEHGPTLRRERGHRREHTPAFSPKRARLHDDRATTSKVEKVVCFLNIWEIAEAPNDDAFTNELATAFATDIVFPDE